MAVLCIHPATPQHEDDRSDTTAVALQDKQCTEGLLHGEPAVLCSQLCCATILLDPTSGSTYTYEKGHRQAPAGTCSDESLYSRSQIGLCNKRTRVRALVMQTTAEAHSSTSYALIQPQQQLLRHALLHQTARALKKLLFG